MKRQWWHNSVVYQIYPRSFNDSNGDGIGDIPGIIEKLDYLKNLGIDVIWLSPLYKSPMDDNGYDISGYREIAPEFGTMDDMDELIRQADKRGIKLLMDLVVNHTSDEHPWFLESRSSKDNPKRDWYIWRDPQTDGSAPNNWESSFTRKAWEYDPSTSQYYLHLFSKKQPDLNWHNPAVRQAVYDMMHFWLRKGIGGFRMDVISLIGKPQDYPDGTLKGGILGWEHWANTSFCHEYLREMNKEVLSHYEILTVGETPFVSPREGQLYSHPGRKELGMVFHFEHMDIDRDGRDRKPIHLPELKDIFSRWQTQLYQLGWNSNYWSNHDQPRTVSRFGNDQEYRVESAKMLGTSLHFLWGTPYIYQGEEIGMTNTFFDTIGEYNDLQDHHIYDVMVHDQGLSDKKAMEKIRPFSRDNARVPVSWSEAPYGGFSSVSPWLPANPRYKEINAEKALKDKNSIFYHYKKLIDLRRQGPVSEILTYGAYQLLLPEHREIYAYLRRWKDQRLFVMSNFSSEEAAIPWKKKPGLKQLLISNYPWESGETFPETLRPYESFAVELSWLTENSIFQQTGPVEGFTPSGRKGS